MARQLADIDADIVDAETERRHAENALADIDMVIDRLRRERNTAANEGIEGFS